MNEQQPALATERLILRPLMAKDAPEVRRLAESREIADTTSWLPYPCSEKQARRWIAGAHDRFVTGNGVEFGIQLKGGSDLFGLAGLDHFQAEHSTAELGFLLAADRWGEGYATEAAQAVLYFGFGHLGLNRIYAHHMVRNPASGRVLAKLGMKQEGRLRQCVRKWEVFEDVVLMALLRDEWAKAFQG